MKHNAALNAVPPLRAQSAELAQADSGARKCGSKLRLAVCSGTFGLLMIQFKTFYQEITDLLKCDLFKRRIQALSYGCESPPAGGRADRSSANAECA